MALNRTIAAMGDQEAEEVWKNSLIGITVCTWLSDNAMAIKGDHSS